MGRNGKCRSVQNRSSGETRWRGAGGKSDTSCSSQGQGSGSCWESKPRDIITSKGSGSALPGRSPSSSVLQPPQPHCLTACCSMGGSCSWHSRTTAAHHSPVQPKQPLPCPSIPHLSDVKHWIFHAKVRGITAHIPVAVSAVKTPSLGCWGAPLTCNSLGLTGRNKHKSFITRNSVTVTMSEAPTALFRLVRTKLVVLASSQHQIPIHEAGK